MPTPHRRLLDWAGNHAWLAPILSVTVLFWITVSIYSRVKALATRWAENARESNVAAKEFEALGGGMLWGSSAILFLAITTASVTVLVFTIVRAYRDNVREMPSPGRTILVLVALIMPLIPVLGPGPFGKDTFVTMELVRAMVPDEIIPVVDVLWVVTMVAAFLVMGAAATCLLGTESISRLRSGLLSTGGSENRADAVESLAAALHSQNRRLQAVLFAGAAVLIAGVVELDALYSWAVSITDLAAYPEGAGKVIHSSAVVPTGTFFSLFLAAAYVPAALILRERASTLASIAVGANTAAKRDEWLQANGLSISVGTQIGSLVALLGPVLAPAPLNALGQVFG